MGVREEDHSGWLYIASQRPSLEWQRTGTVRSPDFRVHVLDFIPWAVDRPFTSAGSLNLDVFRKVKELLSAKNSKQEGQIGWAGRKKEPSRNKTKEEATVLVQAG